MTMNLVLIDPGEVDIEGRVVLSDRRAEHILQVLQPRIGDTLRVGIVRGATGHGTIAAIDERTVTLKIDCRQPQEIPSIDLVMAVPRPKALSRALQTASSFSVRRIDLINTWRVDKSYWTSHKLSPDLLDRDLRLGCEQGNTTWVPDVAIHRFFVPFLQEELAPRLRREPERNLIVAHPHTTLRLEQALPPGDRRPVVLVLGPDGGWIEPELDSFRHLGGQLVCLGKAVLRTEAAVPAILSQVDLLRRLDRWQ